MKSLIRYTLLVSLFIFISCGGAEEDLRIDCSLTSLLISEVSTTNADCETNGSLEVSASGGSGNVEFSIDDGVAQTSGVFSVSAGTYSVTAIDEIGCTSNMIVTVGADFDAVSIATANSTFSGCGTSEGSITVNASGGDGNLMYQLDDGLFQGSNVFNNISAGSYDITVKGVDCDAKRHVHVLSGINLASIIMPIMNANCAISNECHNSSAPRVDLSVQANVISFALNIKSRTQSGNMPQGSLTLDPLSINLIACWVDDITLN